MSSALSNGWATWLLQSVGELTLLLAFGCVLDRYARLRWPPKVRNALWLVILVRLLLPPGVAPSSIAPTFEAVVPITIPSASPTGIGIETVLFWVWALGVAAMLASWLLRTARATERFERVDGQTLSLVTELCRDLALPSVPRIAIDRAAVTPYVTGLDLSSARAAGSVVVLAPKRAGARDRP